MHHASDASTGPARNDDDARYLQDSAAARAKTAERMWAGLSVREQALVKEAAVMGYVQGTRAPTAPIPGDSVTVRAVLLACQQMPDLYPMIAELAAWVPERREHEVTAARLFVEHRARRSCCATEQCSCPHGPTWVCTTCTTRPERQPAPFPCATLQALGRVAQCDAQVELPDGTAPPCSGLLVFRPGDAQARCVVCGGYCGAGVATYYDVSTTEHSAA